MPAVGEVNQLLELHGGQDLILLLRELQEMIQSESARLTGIPQSIISTIENNSVNLGVERAKVLARALRCHPAVLIFSGWDIHKPSGA